MMVETERSATRFLKVPGPACGLAVYIDGDETAPAVLMTHSILSSSMMWEAQARLLVGQGWRVIRVDTRGHGASDASPAPYTMDELARDTVAVLDALKLDRVHYVGLSLGGMSGLGLALSHGERLLSACLCDARADTPDALQPAWTERIAVARTEGTAALASSTVERWFGAAFVAANPALAQRFRDQVGATSVDGFVGCAQAIQGMDYLDRVSAITVPSTLVVGANDGPLPEAMAVLQTRIAGSERVVIPDAGHLPNIDQPALFNEALLGHLARVA